MKHKIIVAITGASGSIYAQQLLQRLAQLESQIAAVGVVFKNDDGHAVHNDNSHSNDTGDNNSHTCPKIKQIKLSLYHIPFKAAI